MAAAARSFLRSSASALRAASARPSSIGLGARRPSVCRVLAAPPRILRLPMEASFSLESLLPLHSATAAARIKSKLHIVPGQGLGWLIEDN